MQKPAAAPSPEVSPKPRAWYADGVHLVAADSAGMWFAACTEPRGTRSDTLVFQRSGLPPIVIERILASRSGTSAVVVEQDGAAVLYDARLAEPQVLENAWILGTQHQHQHPRFDVSADGTSIAYLKRQAGHLWLSIRTVATGAETLFDVGAEKVTRLFSEVDSHFLRLEKQKEVFNRRSTNTEPSTKSGCGAPSRYRVPQQSPPAQLSYLHLPTQRLFDGAQVAATMDNRLIVRQASGELTLRSAYGSFAQISGPDCEGRVIHTHSDAGSVVVGCGKRRARRNAFFRGPARRVDLGFDLAPFDLDTRQMTDAASLPLRPRNKSVLVDLFDGTVTQLPEGTSVLGSVSTGRRTTHLAQRGSKLYFINGSGVEVLAGPKPRLARLHRLLPMVSVERDLFNLSGPHFVGQFPRRPLALTRDGRGLVPARYDDLGLAYGPLTWEHPQPRRPQ